ncbi:MAG: 2-phospho-L-lactate guanylyltransferase [Chloroflexi bacterium]|nr:2-phospho-L-lactate guanylyltransferase [Chloroflexota bacterium]
MRQPSAARVAAIIPVKHLDRAKSRLADQLSPVERAGLVLALLEHVLDAVRRAPSVDRCLVVSPDPRVRDQAAALGAAVLDEPAAGGGQNAALEHARSFVRLWRPAALLIVAADLPRLTPADLEAVSGLGAEPGTVVLAPDRREEGTNLLYLTPPDCLPFCFGPGSFRVYRSEAERRGLRVRVYRAPGTASDLDTPDDLAALGGIAAIAPALIG